MYAPVLWDVFHQLRHGNGWGFITDESVQFPYRPTLGVSEIIVLKTPWDKIKGFFFQEISLLTGGKFGQQKVSSSNMSQCSRHIYETF